MITPEAIISDADGTLVNTLHLIRHGHYETAKTYLIQKNIDSTYIPSYEEYQLLLNQTVGGSARVTLEKTVKLLYKDQPQHLEGLDFDELHDLLNPIQDKIAPEFVTAYEGLAHFLAVLGQLGIKLAIFTSGTPHHIVRNFGLSLPELGITNMDRSSDMDDVEKLHHFEASMMERFALPAFTVVTCDDVSTHKPDPASLKQAMQRLGVTPEKSMVFGDHVVDMLAGFNAGVANRVGITHGFDDATLLLNAGATQIVHSLNELSNQVGNS